MNEKVRAAVNLVINIISAGAAAAMAAVSTADGANAFKRPFVWISILVAVLPVVRATFNETPGANGTGAAMDQKIEAKTDQRIRNLFNSGRIRKP